MTGAVFFISIIDLRAAAYLLRQITEHALGELHHSVVVCVCLVELHKCELRVMLGVYTFVSEYTADLVDSLESADDESLQIELQRNTELYVLIE